MIAKLPVLDGKCDTVTMMSYGMDPYLMSWSPYHGAEYAVLTSVAKIVSAGGDFRKIRFIDSEYAERTRTVCRMHDRACDASCCYRLAVTLLRLHCRLHRKPACLVRCNCTADSSLLSDDDEACKNSVIKIGPPDIDMPGNAKPGILSLLF